MHSRQPSAIKTADLKHDRPPVAEALARMESELRLARRQGYAAIKFIHGYGSSGAGGDIRIAVQKSLVDQVRDGCIRVVIFGEDWRISNEPTWELVRKFPELKRDRDLGHANKGITIVVL